MKRITIGSGSGSRMRLNNPNQRGFWLSSTSLLGLLIVLAALMFTRSSAVILAATQAPYPNSTVISGVTWDFDSVVNHAPGSDNWPITWSDDGHQYTSWGDGGGFGGTNSDGRVSLGFARVEGDHDNFQGINVWGGKDAENPDQFEGKSYGIISVEGVLYAWWGPGSAGRFNEETSVLMSTDHSQTWTKASWKWTQANNLYAGTFLNFGQDNDGARDNYVYSYFPRGTQWGLQVPGYVDLARVPNDKIMIESEYEWFAGFNTNNDPIWSDDIGARQPVFQDPNGLRVVSVTYNPGIGRYLLASQHSDLRSAEMGIFESPEPWGPWSSVIYEDNWGGSGDDNLAFFFSPKWWSEDGTEFTMIFTDDDQWGSIRGQFLLSDSTPPTAPTGLQANAISESRIDLTWNNASDSDSGVPRYKIYRDGSFVGESSNTSYSDVGLAANSTYSYEVSAVNGGGMEGPKNGTAIFETTLGDATKPTIQSASTGQSPNEVLVGFSELLNQTTAETASNFEIDNGIVVTDATLEPDLKTVMLQTSDHSDGVTYTVTVNNVEDLASSPNVIADDSQMSYAFTDDSNSVEDGLIAHWRMDEMNGDTALDSSENTHNGTVVGASWANGQIGGAVDFSGGDQYVEVDDSNDLDLTSGAFTLAAWIYPRGFGHSDQGRIIDHGGGSSGGEGWTWQLNNSGETNAMTVQINADGGGYSSDDNVITLDTWQHVAVTLDGGTMTFFVDAAESGTKSGVPSPSAKSSPIRIGMRSTDLERDFDGLIDDVRIYDRALTSTEIDQIANVNQAPVVDVGSDQTITLPAPAFIIGVVGDDGLPNGTLTYLWTSVGGPGTATFTAANANETDVFFPEPGVYTLKLTADDGELSGSDTVVVTVLPAPTVCPTLPGQSSASLDLDGDGLCEDLNGNQRFDFDDVGEFFHNFDASAIQNNISEFDFNGNGALDTDDVIAHFELLVY